MKKRALHFILFAGTIFAMWTQAAPDVRNQLVTVNITYQSWNEYRPWQKSKPGSRYCLGIVVSENRILVLADNLENATLIQVEKQDRPPRYPARIIHTDPQVNLALLTVDDPAFFDDLKPVKVAERMPVAKEGYSCNSWKNGQLTTSSCRWSRVKVRSSYIPSFNYAGIYFVTDLQGGGEGEPLFLDNELVGMARTQSNDQLVVFPAELIQAYLHAVDQPTYPGFGSFGIYWQSNRGPAQSDFLQLKGTPRGMRVESCNPAGSAVGVLKPNDLILELDGHAIDSQGDYLHPRYGWIDYKLIASDHHYAGDIIPVKVLRNGQEVSLEMILKNIPPAVESIPFARLDNDPPPYLFAGGFVFRELDIPYFRAWGDQWQKNIPARLRIYKEMNDQILLKKKRLIVLADVFPDPYNLGYHDMSQNIVVEVNGRSIESIADMQEAFNHPLGPFHVIKFVPSYGAEKVILDATTFEEATLRIMKTYHIPSRVRLRKKGVASAVVEPLK